MKGCIHKIEEKIDEEGYSHIDVTLRVYRPCHPVEPWCSEQMTAVERERYEKDLDEYTKQKDKINKKWAEIHRLHLGDAFLVQNEAKE